MAAQWQGDFSVRSLPGLSYVVFAKGNCTMLVYSVNTCVQTENYPTMSENRN